MEYTKNYHLPQWAEEDRIMMTDFNQAMTDVESAIDQAVESARQGQESMQEQLNEELAALENAIGFGGHNCRIETGSYTGTGKSGYGNDTKLTFSIYPVAVLVSASNNTYGPAVMLRPCAATKVNTGSLSNITWSGKNVSWWTSDVANQMNVQGTTYYYMAVGYEA